MIVDNMAQAFEVVCKTIGAYVIDKESTKNAGYNIYRSTRDRREYACDLVDRVEINTKDGKSMNVWIDNTPKEVEKLKEKVREQEIETMKLKAKLYDLLRK